MTLHLQIVTPEKVIFDEEVDEVMVPTITGEIAVLPQHVPLLTQIAQGEIKVKKDGKEENMVVMGGFLEVTEKSVSILADYAVHGKDISAVKAQEAKDRAEKAMKEKLSEKDFAIAEAELQRALLELKAVNKYKKTT